MDSPDRFEKRFPILTNIARSYHCDDFIAEKVFPEVKVDTDYLDISASQRWSYPDIAANRIQAKSSDSLPIRLETREKAANIKRSQLTSGNPTANLARFQLELKTQKIKEAKQSVLLAIEMQAARLVQTAGSYDLDNTLTIVTDANRFNSDSSDPQGMIQFCKQIVRSKIAKDPNTITMSQEVYVALKNHLQFTSASTGTNTMVTHEAMKEVLELETILIGNAVCMDETGAFHKVWNTNVVLSYQSKSTGLNEPVFGHTFRHRDYPYSREYWNDTEKDVLAVTYADLLSLTMINRDAGFLIIDAI